MSELQAALLAIGLGVVVAVYLYGWWKQRQYSRKFGAAFKQEQQDVLYEAHAAVDLDETIMINADALDAVSVAESIAEPEAALVASAVAVDSASESSVAEPPIDTRCNFVIGLHLASPVSSNALNGIWQRKFDFRKPLQVYGLVMQTGQWEKVIAETQTLYAQFRIALQLVDRSGVISVAKLGDFRDLVLGIAKSVGADTTVPDLGETHRGAQTLDAFCAEVDQMVGINLLPPGERQLNGEKIAEAAVLYGMKLESDGAFHLSDAMGNSRITLINRDTRPFQHHTLAQFTTSGITLMLDVPRVEHPADSFDHMVHMGHELARELQVNLVDDHRVPLTDAGLALIRAQIAAVEARMCEHNLAPGSAQARRLFS